MKNLCKLLFLALFLAGCDPVNFAAPSDVTLDRDICERCKMVISDKFYVAQVINPADKKHYFFDDLGCAVLWFKEKNITWEESALVYIADAKSGKWIDVKNAYFTDGANSPMRFGFAAHEKEQNGSKSYIDVKTHIIKTRYEKPMSHHTN